MKRRDFLKAGLIAISLIENPLKALEYQSKKKDPFLDLSKVLPLRDRLIQDSELKNIGYDQKTIDDLFMHPDFHLHHHIEKSYTNSPENKVARGEENYEWYKELIKINDKILNSGKFRLKYEKELIEAEQKYGVDRRIIVGLLGIESDFGKKLGDYKAFNALVSGVVTTSDSEIRDKSYGWLKHLLIFCKNKSIPVFSLSSSYAGAIGPMQFMLDSLNDFFVGENPLDIKDAIFSVANFIKNKWYIYKPKYNLKVKASWDMNEKLEDTMKNVISYRTNSLARKYIKDMGKRKLTPEEVQVIKDDIANKTNNRLAIEKYNPSDAFVRAVLEIAVISGFYYEYSKDPNMFRTKQSTLHQ